MLFVGIGILIVLVIATSSIEKSLKTIEKQNEKMMHLLEEFTKQK